MRHRLIYVLSAALSAASAAPAAGQVGAAPLAPGLVAEQPAGWTITPAFDYAFVWDSNVLFDNIGSDLVDEALHVFKPNAVVGYRDLRTGFNVQYNGAFVQHPELTSLNSYDQRLGVSLRRQMTRRVTWFVRHAATLAPTTELLELVGVPFTRLGVHREDLSGGVEALVARGTQLLASYRFQWVDFKPNADDVEVLRGGHTHGGTLGLRHTLTRRVTLAGEYDLQQARVTSGGDFQIQNSWGGAEYQLSEMVQIVGGLGVSRLSAHEGRPARVGPSLRVGISRRTPSAEMSVSFSRSYVPNYGFGGTTDNEELTGRLRVPVARRVSIGGSASLRRNEPLDAAQGFDLRSLWLFGSVGYLLTDWARIEGYASGAKQMSDQVDGRINRYQFGFQITAATTTRIR